MRPILAFNLEDWSSPIRLPVLASPKLDGFRVLITGQGAMTRFLNPLPNLFVRRQLEGLPPGLDGELMGSGSFYEAASAFKKLKGEPSFTFFVFDYVKGWEDLQKPYRLRLQDLNELELPSFCKILPQRFCHTIKDLQEAMETFVAQGHEGVCFRFVDSPYKFGRSTLKEGYLIKYKPFVEAKAEVLDAFPLMHNLNPKEVNALGLTERSSSRCNLVQDETLLGSLLVRTAGFSQPFFIGSGFSMSMRARLMKEHKAGRLIGSTVPFKYMEYGCKDAPRHPVFLEQEYEEQKGERIL